MLDFTGWSLWISASVFLASAAAVWMTGKHLVLYVDRLARRTGMGQGLAGMLLLPGGDVAVIELRAAEGVGRARQAATPIHRTDPRSPTKTSTRTKR